MPKRWARASSRSSRWKRWRRLGTPGERVRHGELHRLRVQPRVLHRRRRLIRHRGEELDLLRGEARHLRALEVDHAQQRVRVHHGHRQQRALLRAAAQVAPREDAGAVREVRQVHGLARLRGPAARALAHGEGVALQAPALRPRVLHLQQALLVEEHDGEVRDVQPLHHQPGDARQQLVQLQRGVERARHVEEQRQLRAGAPPAPPSAPASPSPAAGRGACRSPPPSWR